MIIKIEIDDYDLWNLLIDAISDGAKWPECYRAGLPANRIMHKLKSRCAEYFKKENANSGYPLLADVLAAIEKESYMDDGGHRVILYDWVEEILSKYFS